MLLGLWSTSRLDGLHSGSPSEEKVAGLPFGGRLWSIPASRLRPALVHPVEERSILEMVFTGLANGRLWILEGGPVWVGGGVGRPCIVCQVKIHAHQTQYDVRGPDRSVSVHAGCHRVWRAETDQRRVRVKRRSGAPSG